MCNKNETNSFEFLKLAYQEARDEIAERNLVRERLMQMYIFGSITLVGAAFTATRGGIELGQWKFAAPSFFALCISIQIWFQVLTVERLAEFIRTDINSALIHLKAWAPHWDWRVRNSDDERGKTLSRKVSQMVVLHVPSFGYVVIGWISLIRTEGWQWSDSDWPLVLATVFALAAIYFSWTAYSVRKLNDVPPAAADWYKTVDPRRAN